MSRTKTGLIVLAVAIAGVAAVLLLGRADAGSGREVHRAQVPGSDTLTFPGMPEGVTQFLQNGQSWRAARVMRDYLGRTRDPAPEAILLAARAEAGWGGWERVRQELEGRPWLDTVRAGDGWYWLGRSLEARKDWDGALRAYTRYLGLAPESQPGDRRRVAEFRQGLILLRLGRAPEGAALLQKVREHAPDIAARVDVLAAEALAERGDTAAVRRLVPGPEAGPLQRRGRLALLDAYTKAGDAAGGLALARGFRASAAEGDRAGYGVRAARFALAVGDTAAAREELRGALREGGTREAAELLGALPAPTAADRLAIAGTLDRQGADRDAARFYRAWLALGQGSAAERQEVQLRLGSALFGAGDFAGAVGALAPLVGAPGDAGAQAMLLTGRAESRLGRSARARETFLALATRHPRSDEGAEGLFLVADASHDAGSAAAARAVYERLVRDFPGTDRAGLSLMRLAGMSFSRRDYTGAARSWEAYRAAFPSGERWLESTYWAGRAYEAAGDRDRAVERFRAVRLREPLSYYAVRASERMREPFWPAPMDTAPAENPAARARVEEWAHGVDLLREAGLYDEAESEAELRIARAGNDPTLLYPLAETLNERGYTVRGIHIGYDLQRASPRSNPRLLRIVYPFPYRAMVEAEAREKKLDPFLVAALIRQESSFKARIASGVGARGLMQLMPETGRALAPQVGIRDWDVELLYQPEINAHLGTLFLADQMRAFRGSLPSVFAAYNAGPNRVERWASFPEHADEELFTERIPYRETRDYVKILTRNAAIYRGLYSN
jgi:soluble lytic murein transglycosylase